MSPRLRSTAHVGLPHQTKNRREQIQISGVADLTIRSLLTVTDEYERDVSGALAGFIALHATPRCEVWIVDPDRGNRPAFNRLMAAAWFALSELRLDCAATRDAAAYKGRLMT